MKRSYYANTIKKFLLDLDSIILGELARHHEFALEELQRNAWIDQIHILKQLFEGYTDDAFILFEYAIPRMGKRVDVVLLIKGFVFVLEFFLVFAILTIRFLKLLRRNILKQIVNPARRH